MARRLMLLLCLAAVVALACGSDDCECDDSDEEIGVAIEVASYLAIISVMDRANRPRGLSLAQLPDTVTITNADLRLGPAAHTTGTAQVANEADFEGATAHRGTIHLTGLFTREGNDFVIALTTLLPFQAGDSVGMTMQVTFTSNDHAAGTVQYVEDGETYTGTVTLERYPD